MNYQRGLGFELWIEHTHFGVAFSQCVAAFYYWQECLDYKEYCLKQGVPCVIRTLEPSNTWRAERRKP